MQIKAMVIAKNIYLRFHGILSGVFSTEIHNMPGAGYFKQCVLFGCFVKIF